MHTLTKTSIALVIGMIPFVAQAEDFRILMLNTATENVQHTNVFAPEVLHVQSGDTVTFVPTDTGHNTASKRGMIPEGAQPWNSPMDKEFTVTLTVPGVYGYVCLPHYEMGMVGSIVVGESMENLDAAKKLRHPGAARAAFRELLSRIEEG